MRAVQGDATHGLDTSTAQLVGTHQMNFALQNGVVGADGSATVTWVDPDSGGSVVRVVRITPSGHLSAPATLSTKHGDVTPGDLVVPALTTLSDGSVLAAWPVSGQLMSVRAPADATKPFGTATVVGPTNTYFTAPVLTAGPDGTAAVSWDLDHAGATGPETIVWVARYGAGAWAPAVAISPAGEQALSSVVALATDGRLADAWVQTSSGGGEGRIKATILAP